jgi:hypothetical protein
MINQERREGGKQGGNQGGRDRIEIKMKEAERQRET